MSEVVYVILSISVILPATVITNLPLLCHLSFPLVVTALIVITPSPTSTSAGQSGHEGSVGFGGVEGPGGTYPPPLLTVTFIVSQILVSAFAQTLTVVVPLAKAVRVQLLSLTIPLVPVTVHTASCSASLGVIVNGIIYVSPTERVTSLLPFISNFVGFGTSVISSTHLPSCHT